MVQRKERIAAEAQEKVDDLAQENVNLKAQLSEASHLPRSMPGQPHLAAISPPIAQAGTRPFLLLRPTLPLSLVYVLTCPC